MQSKSDTSNPICISCGYDLSGLPLNDNKVHCPECDLTAIPIFRSKPFTYSDMHKRFALRIFLPTTLPTGISLLFTSLIPQLKYGACIILCITPLLLIILSITAGISVRTDAAVFPKLIRTNHIWLTQCLYTIPGIVLLGLFIQDMF